MVFEHWLLSISEVDKINSSDNDEIDFTEVLFTMRFLKKVILY